MTRTITRNRVRCKTCKDVIESLHVHDFVACSCGDVFVDGGLDYLRRGCPSGGSLEEWIEELSEYEEEQE